MSIKVGSLYIRKCLEYMCVVTSVATEVATEEIIKTKLVRAKDNSNVGEGCSFLLSSFLEHWKELQ